MAFTVSTTVNTVVGNLRLWSGNITPDATTGVVTVPGATAIDCILGCSIKSATSLTTINMAANVNASGVAALGNIGFSAVVATAQVIQVSVLYH
jgi:hypothetical protein